VTDDAQVRRFLVSRSFGAVGGVAPPGSSQAVQRVDAFIASWPAFRDDPTHRFFRATIGPFLRRSALAGATEQIDRRVEEVIAEIPDRGADLVPHLVTPVSRCSQDFTLGFVGSDLDTAMEISHRLMAYLGAAKCEDTLAEAACEAIDELIVLCDRAVLAEQPDHKADTVIGAIGVACGQGEFSPLDAVAAVAQLLTGSVFPVSSLMSVALLQLAALSPDDRPELPRHATAVVLEALRIDPPFKVAARRLRAPLPDIIGASVGRRVTLSLAEANRDPSRWPEPDRFLTGRPDGAGIAFGLGPHRCPGEHLAVLVASRLLSSRSLGPVLSRIDPTRARRDHLYGTASPVSIPLTDCVNSAVSGHDS
jgi:cytochrome P450